MIDWTFTNQATGQRLNTWQSQDTEAAFEEAGRKAQRLANSTQAPIEFTAWHEDREGATAYRYPTKTEQKPEPKKRGRPPKPGALTNAERQAALRKRRLEEHRCPCCGQLKPTNGTGND